ncbi:MAG: holo-ACP synthase [Dermabacter sp.]|nr:holo-ACP synthase [Dermabacter sp.]
MPLRPVPESSQPLERSFAPEARARIAGIGVDVVDMDRLADRLEQTPRLLERLFAEEERGLSLASLAARVAAKEAVGKALGNPGELSWRDVIVRKDGADRPHLVLRGASLTTAVARGIEYFHLSLSHDGRLATAMVVAERG